MIFTLAAAPAAVAGDATGDVEYTDCGGACTDAG